MCTYLHTYSKKRYNNTKKLVYWSTVWIRYIKRRFDFYINNRIYDFFFTHLLLVTFIIFKYLILCIHTCYLVKKNKWSKALGYCADILDVSKWNLKLVCIIIGNKILIIYDCKCVRIYVHYGHLNIYIFFLCWV